MWNEKHCRVIDSFFFFNNVFWRCYCCDSDRIRFILDQARRSIILYITCCFTFMKVTVMCVSCVLNKGEYPQRVASHFLLSEEKSVQLLLNANIELECEDRRSFFGREVDSACPHFINRTCFIFAISVSVLIECWSADVSRYRAPEVPHRNIARLSSINFFFFVFQCGPLPNDLWTCTGPQTGDWGPLL